MATGGQQGFEPVRISSGNVVDEEREPLFFIDDVEFTIPKTIRPNITIAYLRDAAKDGQEVALGKAMEEVLGPKAMDALAESDSVTEDDMRAIMDIVERKLQGQMKRSLGNSRSARRRSGG